MRYLLKMSRADSASGRSILIFTSRRPGRRIAGSIMSSRLEAPMTRTFSSALDAVDLAEQLRDDGVLDVGGDAGSAGAEQRVHLVEEHDDRGALAGLLTGPLEDQADVPLGLADVLVEQLGALDVEEVGLPLLAGLLGDLLGQRVRDRLGDQRLAAAGRAVEQHALGRLELVLDEELGVQVGQLDGVADRLDLAEQAADLARSRCPGPLRGPAPRPRSSGPARRRSRSGSRAAASRRRAA